MTAKMEANAKIKKYEETVKHLYKLLKKVCQERDEARDQLQLLIRNLQASTPVETTSVIPQVDQSCLQNKTKPSMNSTKVSYSSSKVLSDHSCELSLSNLQSNEKHFSTSLMSQTRIVEPSNLTLSNNIKTHMVDSDSLAIDKLVCVKPLPEKGRLLQTVTEAGPLLHTLLIDPVPHWNNPPTFSSLALPLGTQENDFSTNTDHDKTGVNPNAFIPTSLSLAFPGSSHGPSHTSSASNFGLCVDMDSNMMLNHALTGKKRKVL
ncbi:hypothetical protein PHAVU_001G171000 [Phaseolus vulgaris]|uniref:Uncharacterized protein n=1 Tax=Phaseolus vulgaris TaxID=3885 RepID=V7CX54_PHAVU|nr:hypothetical protein PHAVU_001G171000g [Phaseolus vulgaris]ESW34674.1 hypothetical protein PHAVU_001G171000g [Phaseolus vulgaris]